MTVGAPDRSRDPSPHVQTLRVPNVADIDFPGLRAVDTINPNNELVKNALSAGVTAALFIPGSGSNMGGWGAAVKTASYRVCWIRFQYLIQAVVYVDRPWPWTRSAVSKYGDRWVCLRRITVLLKVKKISTRR